MRAKMEHFDQFLALTMSNCFSMVLFKTLLINHVVGATVSKNDLASVLREDRSGEELRRLQRGLRSERDMICHNLNLVNRESVAKAFDAGIGLLPEIWRLEQRK